MSSTLGQDIGRDPVAATHSAFEPGADRAFRGQESGGCDDRSDRASLPATRPGVPIQRDRLRREPAVPVRSGKACASGGSVDSTTSSAKLRPAAAAEPGSTPETSAKGTSPSTGPRNRIWKLRESVDSAPTRSGRAAPPARAQGCDQLFARAEDPVGMIQRDAPRLGQDQLPPFALEQRAAQPLLQLPDLRRKRGLRQVQPLGGTGSGAPRARPRGNSARWW